MKIIFISNYFTHHQSEVSASLAGHTDIEYRFIETEPMEEERKNMGWELSGYPSYVVDNSFFEANKALCQAWIDGADVVIIGSAPFDLVNNRIKSGKLTFIYSERIYKKGYKAYKLPIHFFRFTKRGLRNKNVYLLCASAYTAADYSKTFTFLNKAYKWGYFPKVNRYDDIDRLIEGKHTASILWVARLIDWKHPEVAIEVAKRLKREGYDFELSLIGNGILEDDLKQKINDFGLTEYVHLLGSMTPEEVRQYMEQSEIFLFTSDRREGWGAVLNEAMNSACAVVASHAIGSVPFLIDDGKNGLVYKDGDVDDIYRKTKWLLDHSAERKEMGKCAYATVLNEWNAENAADRLISLSRALLSGENSPDLFDGGVCSKSDLLKDNW